MTPDQALPTVKRDTVLAICTLLGYDPNDVRCITIEPMRVVVVTTLDRDDKGNPVIAGDDVSETIRIHNVVDDRSLGERAARALERIASQRYDARPEDLA